MRRNIASFSIIMSALFMIWVTTADAVEKESEENKKSDTVVRPVSLEPAYRRLESKGKEQAVLNNMRLGLNALQLGYDRLAEYAFDDAILNIETVFANNESAAKARSLWYEEGTKDFKGEPYERALAYYYRGLLYLKRGDYENARSSFKSGILQDAFAEESQYRTDFAALIFLMGWASLCAGDTDLSDDALEELKELRPDFIYPKEHNVLIIVETGTAPRKVADGPGHAELKFRRGRYFSENHVEISINGGEFQRLYQMEDIFWQASTRGGRAIDVILKGKVNFRQTHDKMGSNLSDVANTAMIASPVFQQSGSVQGVSAAIGLISVAQMVMAANANPHADTRYWDNLPDMIHLQTASLLKENHTITLQYKDNDDKIIPELSKTIYLIIEDDKPVLLWLKSKEQIL